MFTADCIKTGIASAEIGWPASTLLPLLLYPDTDSKQAFLLIIFHVVCMQNPRDLNSAWPSYNKFDKGNCPSPSHNSNPAADLDGPHEKEDIVMSTKEIG